ncbi:MAG: CofH family radical SAM protein [Planctomycetes bacterium]|nr:CofH family radical SAM protein [Planctomycetota bacterium]
MANAQPQPDVRDIRDKLRRGLPLSIEEGMQLHELVDIHTLGELANEVRERLHGRNAYYNVNRHINYTNYCVLRCKFCSFYRPYPRATGFSPRGLMDSDDATERQGDGGETRHEGGGRHEGTEARRHEGPEPRPSGSGETEPRPSGSGPKSDEATKRQSGRGSTQKGTGNWEPGAAEPAGAVGPASAGGPAFQPVTLQPVNDSKARPRSNRVELPLAPHSARDIDSTAAGYEYSVDEIVAQAREAYARGATEVHIVGGLHPKLPFSFYLDMCRSIRESCPHLHIKAFTAIEIIHFTRIARPRLSIAEVLTQLREAGLGSLPGGGAEIFDDRVHDEAFKNKVGEAEWFEVHRTAHELGIFTNATMLYGHVETPRERLVHLAKLRAHQEESLRSRRAHFNCVIPLSFIPDGSALSHLAGPSGLTDLKTLAISRLMCLNIPHIKAFWIMQTPKLAQLSLNWGVDDIDGTVVYYDIAKREGHGTHQELTVDRLQRLIREAGCEPVERDTLYRRVIRDDHRWWVDGGHSSFRPEGARPLPGTSSPW